MRQTATALLLFLALTLTAAAQPTIDGTFDGTDVWGSPVVSATDTAAWAGANVKEVYVVNAGGWTYFAVAVEARLCLTNPY